MPRQMVMTADYVNIEIDSVLCYRISDPYTAAYLVENLELTLMETISAVLRHSVGSKTLQECIENKETVSLMARDVTASASEKWGVHVESVLIKDLKMPKEIIENLSAAAAAQRAADAKLLAASMDLEAARHLNEAAKALQSPAVMQLKYYETIQKMAENAHEKIIFMPTDRLPKVPKIN